MARNFTMEDVPLLYEDNHLLVVLKPFNMPSQEDKTGDADLLTLLKGYVKEKYNKEGDAYVGLVHRLDRVTGGIMVFAKTSKAAARLSQSFATHEIDKGYLAVLCGQPYQPQGQIVSYLKKNPLTNTVFVATESTAGAKKAVLDYKILDKKQDLSLAEISLETGRSHQIRVQFASFGNPVYGDVRYGGNKGSPAGNNLALFAYRLIFNHPVSDKRMVFVAYPPQTNPWNLFEINNYIDYFHAGE